MNTEEDGAIDPLNASIAEIKSGEASEQYLTFFMGKEEFGVDILSVQEIRGWEPVTPIPNSPEHVLGVMNLRGTVAPIIDLRMSFGIEERRYTEKTVVIVLTIPTEKKSKIIGVVVDAVSDVCSFTKSEIQPSPELTQTDQAQYVKGLGSTEDKMVILLQLTECLMAAPKGRDKQRQLKAG